MKQYLNSQSIAYLWSKINKCDFKTLVFKSGTIEQWNSDIELLSLKNVLYIYSDYKMIKNEDDEEIFLPGLKWGDGKSYLIDLPFLNADILYYIILNYINNKSSQTSILNKISRRDEAWLIFRKSPYLVGLPIT